MLDFCKGKVSFVFASLASTMKISLMSKVQTPKSKRSLFKHVSISLFICGLLLLIAHGSPPTVYGQVPSPKSVLGFMPADDKTIADWGQITDYFAKLDKASNRVIVKEIGKTTNGKPLIVAFISSPDNIKKLDKYRQISAKLADPRTIKDSAELGDLIKNGR